MPEKRTSAEAWIKANSPDDGYMPPPEPRRSGREIKDPTGEFNDPTDYAASLQVMGPAQRRDWWAQKGTPIPVRRIRRRDGRSVNYDVTYTLDEYVAKTAPAPTPRNRTEEPPLRQPEADDASPLLVPWRSNPRLIVQRTGSAHGVRDTNSMPLESVTDEDPNEQDPRWRFPGDDPVADADEVLGDYRFDLERSEILRKRRETLRMIEKRLSLGDLSLSDGVILAEHARRQAKCELDALHRKETLSLLADDHDPYSARADLLDVPDDRSNWEIQHAEDIAADELAEREAARLLTLAAEQEAAISALTDAWREEIAERVGRCENPNGCDMPVASRGRCWACYQFKRRAAKHNRVQYDQGAERPAKLINHHRQSSA